MSGQFSKLFETLTAIVAVATLPVGILTAIFLGFTEAVAVFVIGWLLLIPVFGILSSGVTGFEADSDEAELLTEAKQTNASDDADESPGDENPLELLRDRYARGEIDEEEFERRVERLVATEAIPPGAISDSEPAEDPKPGTDPERELDAEAERTR